MHGDIEQSLSQLQQLEQRIRRKQLQKVQQQSQTSACDHKLNPTHPKTPAPIHPTTKQQLQQENHRLKKQINRLIRVNDHLRSQLLVDRPQDQPDPNALLVQVEYWKEYARQKQLQLELVRRQNQEQSTRVQTEMDYLPTPRSKKQGNGRMRPPKQQSGKKRQCPLCYQ